MKSLTLFIGFALAMHSAIAADFKNHIFIQLESFKAPSVKVNIHDEKILFRHYYGGHMFADTSFDYCVSPLPKEEFDQIVVDIRNAGFFAWERNYRNDNIRDGSHFKIAASIDDEYHLVNGFNEYPPNFDKIEYIVDSLSAKYDCKK